MLQFEQTPPQTQVYTPPPTRPVFSSILGPTGFAIGVIYAFYKKTGFWKGWGIAIIGGMVLGGIGYGIDKTIKS